MELTYFLVYREKEFGLFTKRMLKNRSTVDGRSTEEIKQAVIMVCVLLPSKMLNVYTDGGFIHVILTQDA